MTSLCWSLDAAQGEIAGTNCQVGNWCCRWRCNAICSSCHLVGHLGRSRDRGRQFTFKQPVGVFTIGTIIPIAIINGHLDVQAGPRQDRVKGPSVAGVLLLLIAVFAGHLVAQSSYAHLLTFSAHQVTIILMVYGLIATSLPVWLLLEPRDYLATYVKLGTIALLVIGIFVVSAANAVSCVKPVHTRQRSDHSWPTLSVSICDHRMRRCFRVSLVDFFRHDTKMLDKETDARLIGYGAMAAEALVAVVALVAACSLNPGDYYAINVPPPVFCNLGLHTVELDALSRQVGENLTGRTGGGVSLAIGMAHIFRNLPLMDKLVGYWYHYAIMFEALFILTTVDAGTRAAAIFCRSCSEGSTSHLPVPNGFRSRFDLEYGCRFMGLPYLHRLDCHDLASFRLWQSTAGDRGTLDLHDVSGQPWKGEICLGDLAPHGLCWRHHACGRHSVDQEHLLADGTQIGNGASGISGCHPDALFVIGVVVIIGCSIHAAGHAAWRSPPDVDSNPEEEQGKLVKVSCC